MRTFSARRRQVRSEIVDCIRLCFRRSEDFGFEKFKIELSVKGNDTTKKYLGSDEDWERAEAALVEALDAQQIHI